MIVHPGDSFENARLQVEIGLMNLPYLSEANDSCPRIRCEEP